MSEERERRELVRELASAVSTQAHVANRAWFALMTVTLLAVLPPVSAKDGNMSLPFSLGVVDPIWFHLVVYSVLVVLAIAFAAAHAQQVRAQRLAHSVIDSLADNRATDLVHPRVFFDMWRMPSLNRVAPLAQSLRGKDEFSAVSRRCPELLRVIIVLYYSLLKLVSLLVYFVLPGWALWKGFASVTAVSWLLRILEIGGVLAGFALLEVLVLDIIYSVRVYSHLQKPPSAIYR